MLRMSQVHVIRHKVLLEGEPIRQVSREMGISRNTVRKYLKQSEPVFKAKGARVKPVMDKVTDRIEQLLEEWSVRTTAKQRITGNRIHRQLMEEGYQVGVTTVRKYLREKRRQASEVYIPLVHRPGDEAQVDFFEITVEEAGEVRKAWKFLMRLMYSGRDFVWIYDRCDQLSFLDGHVRGFAHLGGVPRRVVYDNLSAAVKRRVGMKVELTDRFQALVSHYLYEPCFARPGQGHDKGGVESRGKGIRLQHLTPVPRGASLREISLWVLGELARTEPVSVNREGRTVTERFREEASLLRSLPDRAFEARRTIMVQISRQAKMRIEGATYTVPSHWKRLEGTAYVGVEDIRIECLGESIILPKEQPGVQKIRYRHYLPELSRKPQAVRQVAPELIMELGKPYDNLWQLLVSTHGEREGARVLAKVLGAMVEHGEDATTAALEGALKEGRVDLLGLQNTVHRVRRLADGSVPERLRQHHICEVEAADYDWLLSGGVP